MLGSIIYHLVEGEFPAHANDAVTVVEKLPDKKMYKKIGYKKACNYTINVCKRISVEN